MALQPDKLVEMFRMTGTDEDNLLDHEFRKDANEVLQKDGPEVLRWYVFGYFVWTATISWVPLLWNVQISVI